jgi:Anti-sigma factor NepR
MQQNEVPTRKARGRLSRDTLDKLGKVLEGFYDDVRKEGVPDRFTELLRQYEERNDKGQN